MTDAAAILDPEEWLLAALSDMVIAHCERSEDRLDSFGWAANENAMRLLAEAGFIEITREREGRIEAKALPAASALIARVEAARAAHVLNASGGAMSALPKLMSLDEFLAWEERQELRYEFDGVATYAMTGETLAHSGIQAGLMRVFGNALLDGPCRIYGSNLKVRTSASVRYPDAVISCSKGSPTSTFAPDPVVIFEILSPRSAGRDLGAKNPEYRTLPSLRRYVVLQQRAVAAEVFFRQDDGEWGHDFVGAEDKLSMPEIGVEVALADIYKGVELRGRP